MDFLSKRGTIRVRIERISASALFWIIFSFLQYAFFACMKIPQLEIGKNEIYLPIFLLFSGFIAYGFFALLNSLFPIKRHNQNLHFLEHEMANVLMTIAGVILFILSAKLMPLKGVETPEKVIDTYDNSIRLAAILICYFFAYVLMGNGADKQPLNKNEADNKD